MRIGCLGIIFLLFSFSCDRSIDSCKQSFIGKWKIFKVNYGGKDISKSSDLKNVNSFHFNESGNYAVKGTAAMEESGHVEWIHCSRICLKNEKGGNVFVDFNISDDTLTLDFEMQPKLHMELIPN